MRDAETGPRRRVHPGGPDREAHGGRFRDTAAIQGYKVSVTAAEFPCNVAKSLRNDQEDRSPPGVGPPLRNRKHMHRRPKKTNPSDKRRGATVYPPLPAPPPEFVVVSSKIASKVRSEGEGGGSRGPEPWLADCAEDARAGLGCCRTAFDSARTAVLCTGFNGKQGTLTSPAERPPTAKPR